MKNWESAESKEFTNRKVVVATYDFEWVRSMTVTELQENRDMKDKSLVAHQIPYSYGLAADRCNYYREWMSVSYADLGEFYYRFVADLKDLVGYYYADNIDWLKGTDLVCKKKSC